MASFTDYLQESYGELNKSKGETAAGMMGAMGKMAGVTTKQDKIKEILATVDNSDLASVTKAFTEIRNIDPATAKSFWDTAQPMIEARGKGIDVNSKRIAADAKMKKAIKDGRETINVGDPNNPGYSLTLISNDSGGYDAMLDPETGKPYRKRIHSKDNISTDYEYVKGPDGKMIAQVIPGSKAALEQKANAVKLEASEKQNKNVANTISLGIENAMALVKADLALTGAARLDPSQRVTGIVGAAGEWIRGSKAQTFNSAIDPVKANLSFDTLKKMRDASPTGGALGNVSNIELHMLASVFGNITLNQEPAQLQKTLRFIDALQRNIFTGHPMPQEFLAKWRREEKNSEEALGEGAGTDVSSDLNDKVTSIMSN